MHKVAIQLPYNTQRSLSKEVYMIVHDELDKNGKDIRVKRTRDEAIAYQKRLAFTSTGYVYATDDMALEDYLTVQGAWKEDAPSSPVNS